MSENEISDVDLDRLRQKWGIPDVSKEDAAALAKAHSEPTPAKVLVRKERVWGLWGMHFRYFFIPVAADGTRNRPFTTTDEPIAKQEAERFQKLGVPMEVMKEVEFE